MYNLSIEYQNYSQAGEDGIIEHMLNALHTPNKICVEMGWGNDVKGAIHGHAINCTQNLIQNHGYKGFAFDLKKQSSIPSNVSFFREAVVPQNTKSYIERFGKDVDFFSLDIDSYDFVIMYNLLEAGFQPKTMCVETNRVMGYDYEFSFPYMHQGVFDKKILHGVSLKKYQTYLGSKGYKFFTLCTSGLNAFFYKPECVDENKLTKDVIHTVDRVRERSMSKEEYCKMLKEHTYWKNYINEEMFI